MGDSGNRLWPIDKIEAAIAMHNTGTHSWRECAIAQGYNATDVKRFVSACTNYLVARRPKTAKKAKAKFIDLPAPSAAGPNFTKDPSFRIIITGDVATLTYSCAVKELSRVIGRLT